MSAVFSHGLPIAIIALSLGLMLIRPRNIAEVWWVTSGVGLLLLLRLVPLRLAGRAVAEGSDVYLFLTGMMLLSELARVHGVFDWISSLAVRKAGHQCSRLFLLIYSVGTLTTIFLSNDATAVVLTPAVLSAVRKAKVDPMPYLFACAMVANAASFVFPISNPANLVVFHTGMPSLAQWLASFLVPACLSIVVTYALLRLVFRAELRAAVDGEAGEKPLSGPGKLVLGGLAAVIVVLLIASSLKIDLGLPTCVAAIAISAAVSFRAHERPWKLLRGMSWQTLLLVAGLFVLVKTAETLGALRYASAAIERAQAMPAAAASLAVGLIVGTLNNLVNNLPLGLIAGATVQATHVQKLLANAVLIGVDLGPNLSVTGSLATILWLLAMRKEGLNVSAWSFLKVGLLAMPAAMLAAIAGLLCMHYLTGR